jgi:hypothetical protein
MEIALKVLSVVFPVFCTIGAGFVFARFKKIDLAPILDILLYVTIPALVVSSLSQNPIRFADLAAVWGSVLIVVGLTGAAGFAYLRVTGKSEHRGFLLTSMFMNSGNMAMPLALLAFGQEGLSITVLYYIAVSLLVYSVGVFVAKGRDGFREIFKLPLIYAAVLALALNFSGLKLPGPILGTVDMIGAATIPLMQLSLGYALRSTRLYMLSTSIWGTLVRIGGGLVVSCAAVALLGIDGVVADVIILASVMPSAIINFVMSRKYSLDGELVASIVALSTLASVVTTPIILLWLMD